MVTPMRAPRTGACRSKNEERGLGSPGEAKRAPEEYRELAQRRPRTRLRRRSLTLRPLFRTTLHDETSKRFALMKALTPRIGSDLFNVVEHLPWTTPFRPERNDTSPGQADRRRGAFRPLPRIATESNFSYS